MSFPTTPKLASKCHHFPSFGSPKPEKFTKNRIFYLQMIKLCCEISRINNFQRQSCSAYVEKKICNTFTNWSILVHFTTISVHPSIEAYALLYKRLFSNLVLQLLIQQWAITRYRWSNGCLRNGRIDFHAWYTIGKVLQGLSQGKLILRAKAQ